jgi:hypothetical protein
MRTCPKCKKTIENDLALFCRYCGTKLPEVPKPEEKPEETPAPVSAEPTPAPSPVEEPKPKSVPPPLPPLPNVGQTANVVREADDEVTIIYTPSETPPPIPNFNPAPSPAQEGGGSPQAPKVVNKTPIPSYRKKKKGGSGCIIIAVVFILLIILGIVAFALYYNGVLDGRSSAQYVPDYEYPIDSFAVDSEYVDNDYYYDSDNVIDREEVIAPDPVENYDNVDNVIERIGTDDGYEADSIAAY